MTPGAKPFADDQSWRLPKRQWEIVIPVKSTSHGKSRLEHPTLERPAVATAIALDTIGAAAACDRVAHVLVVTHDQGLIEKLSEHSRVVLVPDTADTLLNAIALGLAASNTSSPRGVLLGDLPALRPEELSEALSQAAAHPLAFVSDAEQTGTALVTAQPHIQLRPLFGTESANAHRDSGFVELDIPQDCGLRRDIDTADHLFELGAARLGRHTAALLA